MEGVVIGENPIWVELHERGGLREITPAMRRSWKLAGQSAERTLAWNLFIYFVALVALGWWFQ